MESVPSAATLSDVDLASLIETSINEAEAAWYADGDAAVVPRLS
jgi:hypothetical protein